MVKLDFAPKRGFLLNLKIISKRFAMKKKKNVPDLPIEEVASFRNAWRSSTFELTSRNAEFSETLRRLNRLVEASKRFPGVPILLLGPAGVGKASLARTLAMKRTRTSPCPFVEVSCDAMRGDEFPIGFFIVNPFSDGSFSEGPSKFNEEKRASFSEETVRFQNATWEKVFETASGGFLFLKEVASLPPRDQALLLHFLDIQTFSAPHSQIRLIASSSTDLHAAARDGRFSQSLLAALSVWTFSIPPLSQRTEDFSDFIFQELEQWKRRTGQNVWFDEKAREKFLRFAESLESVWSGNFRDLRASLMRMIVLSEKNEGDATISMETVSEEIARLKALWAGAPPVVRPPRGEADSSFELAQKIIGKQRWEQLDRFDKTQLADVLFVCRRAQSLSEAGRILFSASRLEKSTTNDTDRLRKYLLKFGLSWNDIQNASEKD